jgi:putative RecB family exonuclease
VPVYSHSRLSTFEKCRLQYRYRYIDRIKRDTQSIEAFMGNRVHDALEKLYRDLLASRLPSLDEVLAHYHRTWESNYSAKITFVKTDRTQDDYRKTGVECLEKYYRGHAPFDDGQTLGLEERVELALDQAGRYQLQGYIDRLVRREEGVYEIHDYKTSAGRLPSDAALRADRQLTLYQMAIEKRFPDAREIRLIWHYLVFDQTKTSARTPGEIEQHRKQTIGLIDTIEATKSFPPHESVLCSWCEYRDICPVFAVPEPPVSAKPVAAAKQVRWLDKATQINLFD